MASVILSRCDGLDALLCMDPNYDKLLDDIDNQITKPEEFFDLVKESNYYAGLIESEPLNEECDDSSIVDEDYDYECGNCDIVDIEADEIFEAMDTCDNTEGVEIGDMIDHLMGIDYDIPNEIEEV